MAQQTTFAFADGSDCQPVFDPKAFFESAVEVIINHYANDDFGAVAVASSFGKDSTLVVILALEAMRRLQRQGRASKPLVIMTSNTRIENPLVERMVGTEMDKILSYVAQHDLPVHIVVGRPSLASSWAVKLISGQGIAPVPGGSSWCTEDWKIRPMRKALAAWAKSQGIDGEILRMTGTRFSESQTRGRKMSERGESATRYTRNNRAEAILSPIADLSSDDVWEILGLVRGGHLPGAYSDLDALFEVYAQAGGTSCAVIADERLNGQQRGECSARTGCMFCTKVSRDESLANMLADHPELASVYAIREWIAAITFDHDRRNWMGRTIRDGYIRVQPDSYAPAVMQDLLRYCLTADVEEQARAGSAGEKPLFQIIGIDALIAIDFYWSLYGATPAFEAWRIHSAIVDKGERYHPQTLDPAPRSPLPAPRYLPVGDNWMQGGYDQCAYSHSGLRDPLAESLEADTGADLPLRTLGDGREILDITRGDAMTVDLESQASWDFLQFMLDDEIRNAEAWGVKPSTAARTYLRFGLVAYHDHGLLDLLLKRAAFREANGLSRAEDAKMLMEKTISEAEHQCATDATPFQPNPGGASLLV